MNREPLTLVLAAYDAGAGKGGTERIVVDLANAMAERGHRVHIAYNSPLRRPVRLQYATSAAVSPLPARFRGPAKRHLRRRLAEIDPDVYMIFYYNSMLPYMLGPALGLNIPVAMQEASNPERVVANWGGPAPALEREVFTSRACRIRVTQEPYRDSFPEYIRRNVRAFPNAFARNERALSLDRESAARKRILHVGGHKANKDLFTLIAAFERVRHDFPDWEVVECCPVNQHSRPILECRKFIRQHHMEDRIQFLGLVEDMAPVYESSHLHVISSRSEGLPNCVCEAMAQALPSIGFADCTGTNLIIRDNENGLLVSEGDRIGGLARALARVMADADLRLELGRQAWLESERFSPARIFDTWEEFFREAAEYKKDPGRLEAEHAAAGPEAAQRATLLRGIMRRHARKSVGFFFRRLMYAAMDPLCEMLRSLRR